MTSITQPAVQTRLSSELTESAARNARLAEGYEATARRSRQAAASARDPKEARREADACRDAADVACDLAGLAENAAAAALAAFELTGHDDDESAWIVTRQQAAQARLCADLARRHAAMAKESAAFAEMHKRNKEREAERAGSTLQAAEEQARQAQAAHDAETHKAKLLLVTLGMNAIEHARTADLHTNEQHPALVSTLLSLQCAAFDYAAAESRREDTSAAVEAAQDRLIQAQRDWQSAQDALLRP